MQIKATERHSFTPIRMATIFFLMENKCWRERQEMLPLMQYWWEHKTTMENTEQFLQKKQNCQMIQQFHT